MVYLSISSVSTTGSVLGAGKSVALYLTSLAVQVPEPGMMLLFGLGAGVLGLRIGRRKRK